MFTRVQFDEEDQAQVMYGTTFGVLIVALTLSVDGHFSVNVKDMTGVSVIAASERSPDRLGLNDAGKTFVTVGDDALAICFGLNGKDALFIFNREINELVFAEQGGNGSPATAQAGRRGIAIARAGSGGEGDIVPPIPGRPPMPARLLTGGVGGDMALALLTEQDGLTGIALAYGGDGGFSPVGGSGPIQTGGKASRRVEAEVNTTGELDLATRLLCPKPTLMVVSGIGGDGPSGGDASQTEAITRGPRFPSPGVAMVGAGGLQLEAGLAPFRMPGTVFPAVIRREVD